MASIIAKLPFKDLLSEIIWPTRVCKPNGSGRLYPQNCRITPEARFQTCQKRSWGREGASWDLRWFISSQTRPVIFSVFCWGLQHFQPQPALWTHLWPCEDPWDKRSLKKVGFFMLAHASTISHDVSFWTILLTVIVMPPKKSPRPLWTFHAFPSKKDIPKSGTSIHPPTVTIPKHGDIPRKVMAVKTWCPRFLPSFWIDEPSSTVV